MATDSAFIIWISNYGQIILFFAQILFWLAIGVAAVWATLIFRRFVNAKVARLALADPAPLDPPAPAAASDSSPVESPVGATAPISIDEFVD